MMLGVLAVLFSGCGKEKQEQEPPVEPEKVTEAPTPTETPTPKPTEETEEGLPQGMVESYLTGEPVPEAVGRRRPVAVMLNNIKAACPQYGINHAGVIYEAPVEGGITRLMGIFEDYDSLDKIGSVRSCRDYYIFYASGFDAIYCHYGEAAYATPYLEMPEVNHLSGLAGYGDQVFYRTSDRKPPHNAYTSFAGIQKGIEINGFSQEYDPEFKGGYKFAASGENVDLSQGAAANTVKPGGYNYNNPWFAYNAETGLYDRFQFGEPQIDEETGDQISVSNIILQNSQWKKYDDNGYLNIDVNTPGTGKYITKGKAIDITWNKTDTWGPTYYYDMEGRQITMNPGKTWVCIILDSSAGETVIE